MQEAGPAYKATSITSDNSGSQTRMSMNLSSAYPKEADVISWNRSFVFDHQKGTLNMTERYRMAKISQPVRLNFLINGVVTGISKGQLLLTNAEGKTLILVYDSNQFDYTMEIKKIDDDRLRVSWKNDLTRLTLVQKGRLLKGK